MMGRGTVVFHFGGNRNVIEGYVAVAVIVRGFGSIRWNYCNEVIIW